MAPFKVCVMKGCAGSWLKGVIRLQAHEAAARSAVCNSGGAELSVCLDLLSKLYYLIATHQI